MQFVNNSTTNCHKLTGLKQHIYSVSVSAFRSLGTGNLGPQLRVSQTVTKVSAGSAIHLRSSVKFTACW